MNLRYGIRGASLENHSGQLMVDGNEKGDTWRGAGERKREKGGKRASEREKDRGHYGIVVFCGVESRNNKSYVSFY